MAAVKKSGRLKLNRERRAGAYREELAKETGIRFSPDLSAQKEGFPFIKYIVNAMILFCTAFGSLYCFITAFELDLNIIPVVFSCVVFSFIFSFMYAGRRIKIIVYLLILFLIIALGTSFYSVVNSGVSALRNHTLSYIDTHSNLPFLREFNTYYSDDYVSMTVSASVLSVILMLLINIFVSEKMSLLALFLITFPITQFGMYFNYNVSKIGMILVVSGWVLVAAVKLTNAYNGLTVRMISRSSVKKHKHSYGFVTDSKNVAQIALIMLSCVLLVTGVIFAAVPQDNFDIALPTDGVKQSTERVVKNFLSYGLGSLFSPSSNNSAPGSLSNVSNVAYDGMTDLKVRVVNYRTDRIYLRQFVGYYYDPDHLRWVANEAKEFSNADYFNNTANILKEDYEGEQTADKSVHKMTVRIVDPDLLDDPLAVPYYALIPDDGSVEFKTSGQIYNSESEDNETAEYTFYTVDEPQIDYSSLASASSGSFYDLDSNFESYATSNALSVPEVNKAAIEEFLETYNIKRDNADTMTDVITEVISALENNYTYTLQPGKVPYGEDYINYFLLANMKGYCQHFASAATMIFRYLGIPARYAEGYVINREDFYMGTDLMQEKKEDWIKTPYSSDNFPTEIDVPDSSGHAWVEVYQKGLGWQVVEATTAPSDDSGLSLLGGIFRNNPFSNTTRNIIDGVRKINTEQTKAGIFRLFMITVGLLLLAYLIRMAVIVIPRHRSFNTSDRRVNIGSRYLRLYDTLKFTGAFKSEKAYGEFFEMFAGNERYDFIPPGFCDDFERALFSGREISGPEYDSIIGVIKKCQSETVGSMKTGKKIQYYLIRIMW